MKRSPLRLTRSLVLGLCLAAATSLPAMARAQSAATAQSASTEMDAILFVQSLKMKDGSDAIDLIWIPQPIQRLCLGKTAQQCANIDFCIRTTSPQVKTCRDLGIPLSRLPSYPANMVPRRQLSVVLIRLSPDRFANLQAFFHRQPKASLEHLSLSARVKARVQLTRTPDDDTMNVNEILAVAPF